MKINFLIFISLICFLFIPYIGIQFISIFVLITLLFSFLSSFYVQKTIQIKRQADIIRAYKNQIITIELEIRNKSFFSIEYLYVQDEYQNLFGGNGSRGLVSLSAGKSKTIKYKLHCRDRGVFIIGPCLIKGADLLGLFPWKKIVDIETKVIVYPSTYPLGLNFTSGLPSGNLKTFDPVFEDVTRFRSIREYIPGDELKRVHWKVSAKIGKLYSKEFMPSLFSPALILLDLTQDHYAIKLRGQRAERVVETAASLIFHFLENKQEIGLVSNGLKGERIFPIKNSHNHAMTMLEALAMAKVSVDGWDLLTSPLIEAPIGCRILYIGPLLNKELYNEVLSRYNKFSQIIFLNISNDKEENQVFSNKIKSFDIIDYGMELYNDN